MDVWKPDVAQLFRAASPATHRTDVAAFPSPSTLSITQALRKHFWGGFAAGPTQGFFPLWESFAPEGVPTSTGAHAPLEPARSWCTGHQTGRPEGQKGDHTQVHRVTQAGASSDTDTPSWGSLTAEAESPVTR